MNTKHRLNELSAFIYIQYIIYLVYIIKNLIEYGYLNLGYYAKNLLTSIYFPLNRESLLFQVMFLGFIFMGIINEKNNLIINEEDESEHYINKKLMKYRIFIVVNIGLSIVVNTLIKDIDISIVSVFMTIISMGIYIIKQIYFRSYIYDRKRKWLEEINYNHHESHNKDTRMWRNKIWINKRVKVKIKDRVPYIISSITYILFILIFVISSRGMFRALILIMIIKPIFSLLENIFSLFTIIDGVCTGKYEGSSDSKSRRIQYRIVVTDYKNQREIKVKTYTNYDINEMDRLTIVHGMFTKQFVSINNIKIKEENVLGNLLPLIIVGVISFRPIYNNINIYLYNRDVANYNNELQEDDGQYYEYESPGLSYMEQLKLENDKELLSLEALGKYEEIILNNEKTNGEIDIKLDRLYLGEDASKLYFRIINNTDRGMVINIDYDTLVKVGEEKHTNILIPDTEYFIEMDILKPYDYKEHKKLEILLEFTLSETIFREYPEHTNYSHYPLNVVDEYCLFKINLENYTSSIELEDYDEFYSKEKEITKFK